MQDGLLLFGDWTGPPAYIRAYVMSILRLVSTNFNLIVALNVRSQSVIGSGIISILY